MTELERIIERSMREARAQGFYQGYRQGWCGGAEAQRRYIMQGDPSVPHDPNGYANPFERGEPEDAAKHATENAYPGVVI